jgi:transposase
MDNNMDIVYERACGIDVHKDVIVACRLAGQRRADIRTFGTLTKDLREMAQWLKAERCQIVAMESTGSYWKPLYNVFEMEGIKAIVVNAQHMKAIPGRKTDVNDAQWIAKLLRHGLLKASFIQDKDQREYRELVRYRSSKVEERSRELNRLQKMLEGANIKISSMVSDINGKSADGLLGLIVKGEDFTVEQIEEVRNPRCKSSAEELFDAMTGMISPLQREMFKEVLRSIREQTKQIERIEKLIYKHTSKEYDKAAELLAALPGIGRTSAEQIIAETGVDMSRFPTEDHLCAWAGISPGNTESAGKRRKSKTRKGDKALKKTLVQCASSAVKNKKSFFSARFQRLVVRLGYKKALVAVARSMLIAIYHVLSGEGFKDLGSEYYTQFNREKKIQACLKQLKKLGWEEPPCPAEKAS